jgi:Holliday junction DNA helicase RuvA
MIAYIKGEIEFKGDNYIIVETGGVGYKIFVSNYTLNLLNQLEGEVKIYTCPYIREDANILYGFLTREEVEIFEMLIATSGIGPKTALNVLSIPLSKLKKAILQDDIKTLQVSNVGKKTAQRILLELKEKIKNKYFLEEEKEEKLEEDSLLVKALISLGFSPSEAKKRVSFVEKESKGKLTPEEIIKRALQVKL